MYKHLKRMFDICIAVPVLMLIYIVFGLPARRVIKFSSYGHSLLTQKRVGKDGNPFDLYKLRTMYSNAKEIEEQNGLVSGHQVEENDPRVFPFGMWLRKSSLDEVPQWRNILRGEMSFIGPRPAQPHEIELWEKKYGKGLVGTRLKVLPGITGWAQVSGRAKLGPKEKLEHDAYYVEHISFFLDLKILFLTVKVVLSKEGAY